MSEYLTEKDVYLRGFERVDLEAFRQWWNNSEVTRYMESGWCPATDKILEDFFVSATTNPKNIVFVIVHRETGTVIGTCGLYEIFWPGRRAEFRIMMGEPSFFNLGYGTQATLSLLDYGFRKANMEVIHLGVNVKNIGAIKSYEKAGFVREGVRRNFVYSQGEYCDALVMSILRSEFHSQ